MAISKLALLLALAIGGLALCDARSGGCQSDKDQVTFSWKASAVKDVSVCPGAAHPDKTKYTAKDNCGNLLSVTVSDSRKQPASGPCGTVTRTLTAACGSGKASKEQKIKVEDSLTFTDDWPVKASSKCGGKAKVCTPVVTYKNCVFKAVYKATDACGVEKTKTVTK